jgi:hypothetical protein
MSTRVKVMHGIVFDRFRHSGFTRCHLMDADLSGYCCAGTVRNFLEFFGDFFNHPLPPKGPQDQVL